MKHFAILTAFLVGTVSMSACGAGSAPADPTANPVDIQSTIAAAAFTVIAETQAYIPTATPPPPTATSTNTPVPIDTPLPLPSPEGLLSPVPQGSSSGEDPCIHQVLPATLRGEPVRIRIDNSTKAALSVSVYLNQASPQSECGYRSYSLTPGQYVVINDLVEGCYTLWAWNPDPDAYFIVTNGTSCIDASRNWSFDISTSSIKLQP